MKSEKITGKFNHIIYYNQDNYFMVASFQIDNLKEKRIVVTGHLKDIELEVNYDLIGEYIEHPKFGIQLQVQEYHRLLPTDQDTLIKLLSSSHFKGIGEKTASQIIDHFGDDVLTILKNDENSVNELTFLNDIKKKSLLEGLKQLDDNYELIFNFFTKFGIGQRNIARLNIAYGDDVIEKVKENPYRMVYECSGFGFKTCDRIGQGLNIELNDYRRIEALLLDLVISNNMQTGDSYIEYDQLKQLFDTKFFGQDFDSYLQELLTKKLLFIQEDRIYHHTQYESERTIEQFFQEFPYYKLEYPVNDQQITEQLTIVESELQINYEEKQKQAIHALFNEDLSILTGGPGTGKTTVVLAMIKIYQKLYPYSSIMLTAPTGRAAKRLKEITNCNASTLHSLLGWDLESNTFTRNYDDPLNIDLLIIDEFSMVDNYLFANLLKASKNIKKICLIGDCDQLPSVGPGALLDNMISSNKFTCTSLEQIFRQKEGSDIIDLSWQIKNNKIDFTKLKNDVAFFDCNAYQVKDTILKIVQNAIEKGYTLNDIQVLASMYNGVAGIDRLNYALQQCFNPQDTQKREVKIGATTYRINDKILQLKNMPDDDVYNGDIGNLIDIIFPEEDENKKLRLIVDFDGVIVEYTNLNFDFITLAYCISVHKSQGSEYPIVIMPIVKEYHYLLQKKLIYTGITRCKKSLVLLGNQELMIDVCQRRLGRKRKTSINLV